MSKSFKLSAALFGHSLDVRSVAVSSTNGIVSGSRDKTAKLWISNGFNAGFSESTTYKDQKNFVASVLYLEATSEFSDGLVITGGNDNVIYIYKPYESSSLYTLKDHSNTVCYLSKGIESNTFLSSSWDNTAKLWCLTKQPIQSSKVTYVGHTAAVWSVIQLQNTNIVTASADKTIGVYSIDGYRINTIQGHKDCVRGLADFPELNYFLSVSNDATIKMWSYNGENLNTYYEHTNYIYCIARNTAECDNSFVTAGEDRTVRYWKDGINTETFQLPAQSVWTVACFSNGDIITGSSDSVVRIFTQEESRFASEQDLKTFEEEVLALTKQSVQEIGGYKVSDLPGKEALYEPGRTAGQMKMIRESHGVVAYTWIEEGDNSHWEKVGDVLGGANPDSDNKTTYEGKAYDFVFSVDVEDGKPPLKLPYNKGDDPYVAAHNFLEKNMLPAAYLDQVVSFILTNSKDPNENQQVNSNYVDPFTGGSRYTPLGNTSSSGNSSGVNLDPFTGRSSYTSRTSANSKERSKFFPQYDYRRFDMGDPNVMLKKLKEFNEKMGSKTVETVLLENLVNLCNNSSDDPGNFEVLFNLLHWEDEMVFPVLDVIRMAVRQELNNKNIVVHRQGFVMKKLLHYVSQDCKSPNSTLVAVRVLCNMFLHAEGERCIFDNRIGLLENIASLGQTNKNTQIALATFLLNSTILCQKFNDEFGFLLLASIIPDNLLQFNENEAQFRVLVAIGTLLSCKSTNSKKIVEDKMKENQSFLQKLMVLSKEFTNETDTKRYECAVEVLALLQI